MKRRERLSTSDQRCVFCLQEMGTTDEHIIPRSIGGELIIKDGTCLSCLRAIQAWEAKLLSTHFSSAQAILGIKTGSGKPRRRFKGPKWNEDFASFKLADLRPDEHSGCVTTVNFEKPGIEVGRSPQEGFGRTVSINITQIGVGANVPALATVRAGGGWEFAPFLAKIAHSYWVAKRGHDSAHFVLQDLILGSHLGWAGYFIGRCEKVLPNDDLHFIEHRIASVAGEWWGCVDIALFSCFNSPDFQSRYTVYVGKLATAPYILRQPSQSR